MPPATPAPRHQHLFPQALAPRTPSYDEADVSDKPEYIRQLPLLSQSQKNRIDRLYRRRLRSLQAVDKLTTKRLSLSSLTMNSLF